MRTLGTCLQYRAKEMNYRSTVEKFEGSFERAKTSIL